MTTQCVVLASSVIILIFLLSNIQFNWAKKERNLGRKIVESHDERTLFSNKLCMLIGSRACEHHTILQQEDYHHWTEGSRFRP
uniref:Putative secreted protein n=1 Tax=Anopheles darlingi TaxID=43151 RepID=A0A2M4D2I7_ANODA